MHLYYSPILWLAGAVPAMVNWYRLYHEVEVSTRFTHRGPQARGCVNRVETEPSDVTDLYHGLRGPDNTSTA
jgi:hypothetical protein